MPLPAAAGPVRRDATATIIITSHCTESTTVTNVCLLQVLVTLWNVKYLCEERRESQHGPVEAEPVQQQSVAGTDGLQVSQERAHAAGQRVAAQRIGVCGLQWKGGLSVAIDYCIHNSFYSCSIQNKASCKQTSYFSVDNKVICICTFSNLYFKGVNDLVLMLLDCLDVRDSGSVSCYQHRCWEQAEFGFIHAEGVQIRRETQHWCCKTIL